MSSVSLCWPPVQRVIDTSRLRMHQNSRAVTERSAAHGTVMIKAARRWMNRSGWMRQVTGEQPGEGVASRMVSVEVVDGKWRFDRQSLTI